MARKAGEIPSVSTRFSLTVDNEETGDAGWGRPKTCLARPNSQAARTRTEENYFPCSADHEQD